MLLQFNVGDAVDLSTEAANRAVASFVTLRIESPAVPGDVVDLQCPSTVWNRDVGMDQLAVMES